jgi:hypothetical protein
VASLLTWLADAHHTDPLLPISSHNCARAPPRALHRRTSSAACASVWLTPTAAAWPPTQPRGRAYLSLRGGRSRGRSCPKSTLRGGWWGGCNSPGQLHVSPARSAFSTCRAALQQQRQWVGHRGRGAHNAGRSAQPDVLSLDHPATPARQPGAQPAGGEQIHR